MESNHRSRMADFLCSRSFSRLIMTSNQERKKVVSRGKAQVGKAPVSGPPTFVPTITQFSSKPIARIFHESLATTTDMGVLPGVLGCRLQRRTRSGTPRNQSRGTAGRVARWPAHLHGLATAIHEISGLVVTTSR